MGVLSTTDRRLTSTGTISFVPDLRAAVDIDFTMTGAWQNGVELTGQTGTFNNYETVAGSNPKVNQDGKFENVSGNILNENGEISYSNLEFNPGADKFEDVEEIVLTFEITNNSAISARPLIVNFTATDSDITDVSSPIKYTPSATELSINNGSSKTLTITLSLASLPENNDFKDFKFQLTFSIPD